MLSLSIHAARETNSILVGNYYLVQVWQGIKWPSVFPWAHFRKTKGGIKLHTLLDLKGNIPSFIAITEAVIHEINILDELTPKPGAIYIIDRGYLNFERL